MNDVEILEAIQRGTAFPAEVEGDLEDRGLIRQTDQPYAEITPKGLALLKGERLVTYKVGDRVRLRHDVDRYPHFVADAGSTGVVVEVVEASLPVQGHFLAVRMDEPLPGAREWDNEIHWDEDDPDDDIEVIQ